MKRWRRAQHSQIVESKETLTILGMDDSILQFSGESAQITSALLDLLVTPRAQTECVKEIAALADASPADVEEIVSSIFSHLLQSGTLVELDDSIEPLALPAHTTSPPIKGRVLLGITGAIAAMHTPALVGRLVSAGWEVEIALSEAATQFVQPRALEALTHKKVHTSLWGDATCPAKHIHLAAWAEWMLIYPASATTLSRIATGDCSQLISTLAITTQAPTLLAPSMNPAMLKAPSTQRNLQQLREDGFSLLHPTWGVEIAQKPERRSTLPGPAPRPSEVFELFEVFTRQHPHPSQSAHNPSTHPRTSAEWDALYADPTLSLSWNSHEADEDFMARLKIQSTPSSRLLDIGTGRGALARKAAQIGLHVVATDISPLALQDAANTAKESPVIWLQDDFLHTKLIGPFEWIIDRGLFHLLDPSERTTYIKHLQQLSIPGTHFMLKVLTHDAQPSLHITPYSSDELQALFAPFFRLEETFESTFKGPDKTSSPAIFSTFVCQTHPAIEYPQKATD